MKCLCFSDSHGSYHYIRAALNKHLDAEVVFYLGDGLRDIEDFVLDRSRAWFAVQGNCDYSALLGEIFVKKTDSITIMGKRIFLTHGDLYGVKYGLDGVKKLAIDQNADLVLFGHTHQPLEKYISTDEGGFYLFNPGSIGGGYGGASYGIINITDKGILLSHGSL
jgi:putative phosphoesterase